MTALSTGRPCCTNEGCRACVFRGGRLRRRDGLMTVRSSLGISLVCICIIHSISTLWKSTFGPLSSSSVSEIPNYEGETSCCRANNAKLFSRGTEAIDRLRHAYPAYAVPYDVRGTRMPLFGRRRSRRASTRNFLCGVLSHHQNSVFLPKEQSQELPWTSTGAACAGPIQSAYLHSARLWHPIEHPGVTPSHLPRPCLFCSQAAAR